MSSDDLPFGLGVSLYSYTDDIGVTMTIEDCIEDVADLDATGLEILGEGHIEDYPNPSTAWIDAWFARNERLGLTPTLYGSWLDTRRFPGRGMTVAEGAQQLELDLRLAAQLGFSFVRPKIGVISEDLRVDPIWQEAVQRNLQLAADLDIVICPEIHWPTVIKSPVVEEYLEFKERTGSAHFGLLIDTGVFESGSYPRTGGTASFRMGDGSGRPPVVPFVPASDLADVMEHTVYFQAKFYEVDDQLVDHYIPWQEIIEIIVDSGYTGWLSSEYEGNHEPHRASDQLRRQHALYSQHRRPATEQELIIMPNGLIDSASLRTHPEGFALALTIPWYRSLWLSSVSTFRLSIDDVQIPETDLAFVLDGVSYRIADLPQQSDVLWYLQSHPLLVVRHDPVVALGETHEIDLLGELRLPYMQIAPGQDGGPGIYVPNVVHQRLTLSATDRDAEPPVLVSGSSAPPVGSEADPFQLGLTLYSASAEFRAGWFDFDGLLDRVAELAIGPGIEIVASQVLPTYPVVSDEFVSRWREAFDRHGFDASSFGANLDMGLRRDRDMTPDEEFEFSELLFQGAKKLGFPLVRIQSAKPDLLRRLLPIAEQLELKLAYEIHAPMGPNAPEIVRVRDLYAELDSPLLGFVADFSSTMHSMSPTLLRAVQRAGLDDDAVAELQRIWSTDAPMRDRQQEFIGYLNGRGFDPGRLGSFAHLAFNMHGHVDPREWSDIMPQILHVHAKFYDIDEHGQEPAIDYPELVRIFVEGGYRGYWSSEWEGHAFAELGEVDPLLLVRKQHDLIRASMRALQTA